MKILIADDSRVMRQIVTRTLRQAGFDPQVIHRNLSSRAADAVEGQREIGH